ncbi:oxidoreductase [Dyadobacter sp.]|uniref:oxidoreductase n=1 Tax=Dyadobacter sp. TaxID=1914288 RepID=UPI003F6F574F
MSTQKVWFITGASKGLGLTLTKQLLAQGQKVAATSRNLSELKDAVGVESNDFLPLALNLTNEADVQLAIANTITAFGGIDVLVNNAGYGLTGALEELSDAEARANFDINVFGALNLIRQVLPQMRNQQSGHIFNISSIGGFAGGFPGFGIYCATKFAMHGFSESLFHEVAPFGIRVTLVMPGYFRTNFLGAGSLNTPQKEMTEYTNVRESQQAHQNSINANQPGDPEKAAAVFISVAEQADPPFHLFLGEDAYEIAGQKIALVQQEMEAQRALATATNF